MADLVEFSEQWRKVFGVPPSDYVTWDVETTGFDVRADRIIQLGWVPVRGGVPGEPRTVVVDWTRVLDRHGIADFESRMARTCYQMYPGMPPPWTMERITGEGVHPAEALQRFASEVLYPGPILCGHNTWAFDQPRLDVFSVGVCRRPVGLPETRMIDTAALVKGCQSGTHPVAGDSYRSYSIRAVRAGGSKYRYKLSDYCFQKFALERRYGVDVSKCHDAGYDSLLAHYVYSDLRQMIITGKFPADEPEAPWG